MHSAVKISVPLLKTLKIFKIRLKVTSLGKDVYQQVATQIIYVNNLTLRFLEG